METEKQHKAARKRKKATGTDIHNINDSALSDDAGNKPYSIRSRRLQSRSADDAPVAEVGQPSSTVIAETASPHAITADDTPTTPISTNRVSGNTHQASPAVEQVTRELHARIMSRVRDLAPTFTAANKPSATTSSNTSITRLTSENTVVNTHSDPPSPSPSPSPSPTPTPTSAMSKNTTQTVKELQQLISQYVLQQRAQLGISSSPGYPLNSAPNTPTSNTGRSVPTASSLPNTQRAADMNTHRGVTNNSTIKSSVFANKFSNAIKSVATSNFGTHPSTLSSHYATHEARTLNHTIAAETGPSGSRSTSYIHPVTSVLNRNVPSLSIQFKHNQKEKRRKTEYGYYDDASSSSSNNSEGSANYFLLAAQHELQNMDEEMATMERLEIMENELERLQRAIATRDRVIKRLHDEIEEKDSIIKALPYELVSNWVAASRMMSPSGVRKTNLGSAASVANDSAQLLGK